MKTAEARHGSASQIACVNRMTRKVIDMLADEDPLLVETVLCNLLAGQIALYAGKNTKFQDENLEMYAAIMKSCLQDAGCR